MTTKRTAMVATAFAAAIAMTRPAVVPEMLIAWVYGELCAISRAYGAWFCPALHAVSAVLIALGAMS